MINTNNFFKRNTTIRNPAAPYKKGKFVDQSPEYKSRVFSRVQESPLTKTLLSMRKNVLGIENALRGLFELDKKKQATDQKFDLAQNQEAKDRPKVKPKTPKIFGNIIEKPKTGVIDAIKNFVTFTFLGWLFTRLQPFIDKAGGLVPLLEGIMKFFSGLIVGTLNSFASFLKFGYDAKDTFDLKIKEIKKETEGIGKHFDNTLGELKAVFSGAIEVVNSFLNTSVDEEELKTARLDAPKDSSETNIPPLPKLPDNKTVSPSLSTASNINGDSPIGKTGSQTAPMPTTSPTIYKVNTGGRIDPTKTPITRGTEQKERRVIRRKPDIQQQKTVPGKDVGGEDKVKEVYGEEAGTFKPDFIPNSIFFRTENKSGYAGLLKAAEEYKRPNDRDILGLGNLMGATVDTALGQKLERRTITQFADGIKYLVEQGMSNPEEFKKIDLELMLRRIIEPKIEAAINKIRDEVNKKSKEKPIDLGLGPGGGGGITVTGEDENFWTLAAITSLENQNPQGQADVAQAIYNRVSSGLNFGQTNNSIKGHIIAPRQFSPVHESNPSLWARIKDRESAIAAVASHRRGGKNAAYMVDQAAANITDPILQKSAAEGIGGRTDFAVPSAANIHPGGHGFVTRHGHLFGWYVGPESISFGRGKPKATQVPSFGVQRHEEFSTPTGPGATSGAYASGLYIGPPGDLDGQQTGLNMNLPGGIGTPIYAPFDLIYRSKGTDGNPSVGLQGTPGALGPNGRGFGFYGSYYYKVGNKEYEVFMGHFKSLPLRGSKEGQIIPKGTLLGYQGASGRSVSSTNGVYPHITLHVNGVGFRASNSELIRVANSIARVKPGATTSKSSSQTQPQQPKRRNTRGGGSIIVEPRSQSAPLAPSLPRGLSSEGYLINGKMYYLDLQGNRVLDASGNKIEVGPGKNEWLLKEIYRLKQLRGKRSSLNIRPPSPILPEQKYASYNDPTAQRTIATIQPLIIEKLIPDPTGSGSVIAFAPPSVSPNYKSQSLSRA